MERAMRRMIGRAVLAAASLAYPAVSLAYVGPGLGVGALALLSGLLGSILLALLSIFWYPLKRLLQRLRPKGTEEAANAKQADKPRATEDEEPD